MNGMHENIVKFEGIIKIVAEFFDAPVLVLIILYSVIKVGNIYNISSLIAKFFSDYEIKRIKGGPIEIDCMRKLQQEKDARRGSLKRSPLRDDAEQGDVSAQAELGTAYFEGCGVAQDYVEAAKWFHEAAEQGDAFSQAVLGLMYGNGLGVEQDSVLSHMWLNIAYVTGSEHAKELRDKVAKAITPSQLAEAQKCAREWLEQHNKPS